MDLARREGLDFSMRDLGHALSSWANTVYAFFPSKQALQDALIDRIIDEALSADVVERVLDDAVPWQARFRTFGLALFDTFSKYPGTGVLITQYGMLGSPNAARLFQLMITLFTRLGLSPQRAAIVLQASAFFLLQISDLAASIARGQANADALLNSDMASGPDSDLSSAIKAMADIPIRDRAVAGLDLFIAGLEREI